MASPETNTPPERQPELTDRFIDDLLADARAATPAELQAETADFVRYLIANRQDEQPDDAAKERVWNQILFGVHATVNLPPSPNFSLNELLDDTPADSDPEPPVITPPLKPRLRQESRLFAAAMIVVLLVSGLFLVERVEAPDTAVNVVPAYTITQRLDHSNVTLMATADGLPLRAMYQRNEALQRFMTSQIAVQ